MILEDDLRIPVISIPFDCKGKEGKIKNDEENEPGKGGRSEAATRQRVAMKIGTCYLFLSKAIRECPMECLKVKPDSKLAWCKVDRCLRNCC